MKKLFIALFMFLPLILSAATPHLTVHAHDIIAGHTSSDHGHHHPSSDDCDQEGDTQTNTPLTAHVHDGKVHEYMKAELPDPIFRKRVVYVPPSVFRALISEDIEPLLEPPTYS